VALEVESSCEIVGEYKEDVIENDPSGGGRGTRLCLRQEYDWLSSTRLGPREQTEVEECTDTWSEELSQPRITVISTSLRLRNVLKCCVIAASEVDTTSIDCFVQDQPLGLNVGGNGDVVLSFFQLRDALSDSLAGRAQETALPICTMSSWSTSLPCARGTIFFRGEHRLQDSKSEI